MSWILTSTNVSKERQEIQGGVVEGPRRRLGRAEDEEAAEVKGTVARSISVETWKGGDGWRS